jgi:hypothetical protein
MFTCGKIVSENLASDFGRPRRVPRVDQNAVIVTMSEGFAPASVRVFPMLRNVW